MWTPASEILSRNKYNDVSQFSNTSFHWYIHRVISLKKVNFCISFCFCDRIANTSQVFDIFYRKTKSYTNTFAEQILNKHNKYQIRNFCCINQLWRNILVLLSKTWEYIMKRVNSVSFCFCSEMGIYLWDLLQHVKC